MHSKQFTRVGLTEELNEIGKAKYWTRIWESDLGSQ